MDNTGDEHGGLIKFVPTIKYFEQTYGISAGGNDQKAISTFKMFESLEKVRRLQNELQAVRNGGVDPKVCDNLIGKKRQTKYQTYENWARLMLQWLAAAKK